MLTSTYKYYQVEGKQTDGSMVLIGERVETEQEATNIIRQYIKSNQPTITNFNIRMYNSIIVK